MYKFNCSCGILYVSLSCTMLCPNCGVVNESTACYIYSPETACHQLGVRYDGEPIPDEVSGLPKLALSAKEYKAWDLDERCFWAGCGGCMKVNEKGIGRCTVCSGEIRVFS